MGDQVMPQVVTAEQFQALREELNELKKKIHLREKGEWVSAGALEEVPLNPTKQELEASERKKLLKAYPEDTRFTWQGASLDKEQRGRMTKEAKNLESNLFDFQGEILEALRPLLDILDVNWNEERRDRLLRENRILEEITTAALSSYKLLAGTTAAMETARKEIALSAISPKLASIARPAPANPLINQEDRERMEAFHKEESLRKRLAGESSQPFRGSGQRGGNAGRGNFSQGWRPYQGGGQPHRGRGRGRGAPQHLQQNQHQQLRQAPDNQQQN